MDIDDILTEFETGARAATKEKSEDLNQQMVTAMLNERMAPDLLPYKHELMKEVLTKLLNQQQYLLDSYEYGDSNAESGVLNADFKLQLMIIETEIERLSYLVRLYVRTRLAKIDNFTIFYINETSNEPQGAPSLMTDQEKSYMHKHFKILTQLYNNSFLKKFPEFLTFLDDSAGNQNMITTPELNQPVFIRVIRQKPIILNLGHEGELELVHKGVYVVIYRLIKPYLDLGEIELI
ncbi:CIC11C00000002010 [Sungouiella intermedia]|uniref:DNA replication complex GINS protein SLD5 n=1 Tax=Sungouiella intermedia TaxID=45354 RepID=A0A1L0C1J0_9ASCO|nr:CIC11C00000002010 [[Candida] intermedia]